MPAFTAPDGTLLAYRETGTGHPLVCLDSHYLGDLGGLSAHRRLILLDLRGTGQSTLPEDISSYRCDRLVDDVESLREHLGLATIDLLGHSASTNVATQYVARYPKHVDRLVLVGPSTRAVGIEITAEMRREVVQLRKDEPWFPAALAAFESLNAGKGGDRDAIAPFFWGRWDTAAREFDAAHQPSNKEAIALFGAEGAFDPQATRAALATCESPALLLVGEFDVNSPPRSSAEFAKLFPHSTLVVQPGAGHYPWRDDPDRCVATIAAFLG